ncbi:hypothetical protein CapIbe_000925 [Capra ibex]
MPGLRPGWSFPEHVAPDRATGCSRKAPGLSPGSSERHQEDQIWFLVQTPQQPPATAPPHNKLQLSHLPAHASHLCVC